MTQQQLADTETSFNQRLTAQQVRHKQELTREQERVKRSEKLLKEEHERGNSLLTRVKDLEVQNSSLRSQISEGALKRQSYLDNSYKKSAEIRELRGLVGDSFNSLAKDPAVDSSILQHEAGKLDRSYRGRASPDRSISPSRYSPRLRHTSPERPVRLLTSPKNSS